LNGRLIISYGVFLLYIHIDWLGLCSGLYLNIGVFGLVLPLLSFYTIEFASMFGKFKDLFLIFSLAFIYIYRSFYMQPRGE
jgi:hypothetical protein